MDRSGIEGSASDSLVEWRVGFGSSSGDDGPSVPGWM